MFRLFLCCLIFLCALGFYSCDKDAPVTQPKAFSRATLTAHPWKLKALLYRKKGDSQNSDFTNFVYKSCELDDIYIFTPDSAFEREENNDVCTSTGYFGLWGQGNWQGNGDLTKLTVENGLVYLINFNVLELNNTSFILEEPTRDYLENDIVYTYEFVPE
jgi:hypothetical protein